MTKEEILNHFKDINHAYNNSTMLDKLESMLDALIETIQEPCEDCVSRVDAIKAMDELEREDIEAYGCSIPEGFDGERARQALCLLPPVTPMPKIGKWIACIDDDGDDYFLCSECHKGEYYRSDYCPHCGSKLDSTECF